MAKNSAPNIINKPAALKKTSIKLSIEWTGFLEAITINEKTMEKIENTEKSKFSVNIIR